MRFYETHYEDYLQSLQIFNLHPELIPCFQQMPQSLANLSNIIIYGPSGVGKYTQALKLINRYSTLSHDKKINVVSEKYDYTYHMSDIHFEIDMSLLGCNSKLIWHDIIQQIVDILSVKSDSTAIVLCKNFHMIHSELCDIFFSYMQEYNSCFSHVHLKFILITEHLCFIPNNILKSCLKIHVKRPTKDLYLEYIKTMQQCRTGPRKYIKSNVSCEENGDNFFNKIADSKHSGYDSTVFIDTSINVDEILNIKELHALSKIKDNDEIPADIFNIVCNTIIEMMLKPKKLVHSEFRDAIYDIFVYNLDIVACIWYILCNLVDFNHLRGQAISDVMVRSYNFLKYYNNNYRPIYHLESILHYMIIKIYGFNELCDGM